MTGLPAPHRQALWGYGVSRTFEIDPTVASPTVGLPLVVDHLDVIRSRSPLARARSAEEGATAVEYGLLIATITVLVMGILLALFGSVADAFTYVTGFLS